MSEPASSAAAGYAGQKAFLLGLPIAITLIAWGLGMRLVPLRKGREHQDMMDRLIACAVSSFVVGIPALVLLHLHAPGVFGSATALAAMAEMPAMTGFFAVVGCVLLLCSLPGPWLVVAYVRWFERRKGKDIGELARDAADDVRNVTGAGK